MTKSVWETDFVNGLKELDFSSSFLNLGVVVWETLITVGIVKSIKVDDDNGNNTRTSENN